MKKPSVNTLALGNLKTHKKQYLLLIVGIILAIVFSSGTLFLVSGIINGTNDLRERSIGREDAIFFGINDRQLKAGIDTGVIKEYAEGKNLGYLFSDDESKGTSVACLTPEAVDLTYTYILDGAYPENAGEIALEADALVRLRIDAGIGETVTLNMKPQSGNDYVNAVTEKQYKLTGILHDRRSNIERTTSSEYAIPAAFVCENEEPEPGSKPQRVVFAVFPDASKYNSYYDYYEFCEKYDIYSNGKTIDLRGGWYGSGEITSLTDTGSLAAVLSGVFMLVSCVGIVNAFQSNLNERKKQIGLLRAIGTTRRQIIKIFGREALILALICTPPGVAVSYFGAKAVITGSGDGMLFLADIRALILGAAVSVICVMAAALIPLAHASRVSPMQAVRSTDTIRRVRKIKLKQKSQFNVASLTARRNMTLGRGRLAFISIMITACILLTGLGFSFLVSEYKHDIEFYKNYDYDYSLQFCGSYGGYSNIFKKNTPMGFNGNDVNDILSCPYVKRVEGSEERFAVINFNENEHKYLKLFSESQYLGFSVDGTLDFDVDEKNYLEINEKYSDRGYDSEYTAYMKKFGNEKSIFRSSIYAMSESELASLKGRVIEGKIDIDKLNSGEEVIIAMPKKAASLVSLQNNFNNEVTILYFNAIPVDENGKPRVQRGGDADTAKQTILYTAEPDVHPGDELDVSVVFEYYTGTEGVEVNNRYADFDKYDKKVKVGAVIESRFNIGENFYSDDGCIITSLGGLKDFGIKPCYTDLNVFLKGECTEEINAAVTDTLNRIASGNDTYCFSKYETVRSNESEYKNMITALIAVVALMFTVSASMINNSITAQIRAGRRSIGTLRAVGASLRELTKSYIYQLMYLFGIGAASGCALFVLCDAGMKIYVKITGEEILLKFMYYPVVIVCVLLFAVCVINLLIQLRKLTKTSIVENIREL